MLFDAGGTIIQYVGDEVFAVFGAPVARSDHAEVALRCALAVQAERTRLEVLLAADDLPMVDFDDAADPRPRHRHRSPRRWHPHVSRDRMRRPARPVGHARQRTLRLGAGRSETHTPRRARCRACRRTHVLVSTRSYPRRPDSVETVGAALLAAASGLGHRRVAKQVGLPATTVRGWLRRARANSDAVPADATVATYRLDSMAHRFDPTGSALGDMLDAVGRAISTWTLRFGPEPAPWQLGVALTGAAILAPVPEPRWHGSG